MGTRKKRRAVVDAGACVACGCCAKVCPVSAIEVGCGRCERECPASVIELQEVQP